jgi:hypothetical protein
MHMLAFRSYSQEIGQSCNRTGNHSAMTKIVLEGKATRCLYSKTPNVCDNNSWTWNSRVTTSLANGGLRSDSPFDLYFGWHSMKTSCVMRLRPSVSPLKGFTWPGAGVGEGGDSLSFLILTFHGFVKMASLYWALYRRHVIWGDINYRNELTKSVMPKRLFKLQVNI